MKDRLRKRRQSRKMPDRYKVRLDLSKYDPDGWPKGHRITWPGTLRRRPDGTYGKDKQE